MTKIMKGIRRSPLGRRAAVAGFILATFSATAVAAERDMADYFSGKTIELIVPSPPAGGYDVTARLLARFLPRHFPGEPKVIVRNVAGAAGMRALEHTHRAKPDGLTALSITIRHIMQDLAGENVRGFSVRKTPWIGAPNYVDIYFLICGDRKVIGSWEDALARKQPLLAASDAPGARVPMGMHFVELIGGPMKMIWGYEGVSEQKAAFYRGETQAVTCLQRRTPKIMPELLKEKRLVPLFYWNGKPGEDWLKQLGGPAPRHIMDLPGLKMTQAQRSAFETAVELYQFFRIYMLRPGTPDDIHRTWVKAFADTIKDPEYVAAAEKSGFDPGYGSPEDFKKTIGVMDRLDPEGMRIFRELIGK